VRESASVAEPTADRLFAVGAAAFMLYLLRYYATGTGGPTLLAVQMTPGALALLTLRDLGRGEFYPRAPRDVRRGMALICIGAALGAALYLRVEFEAIRSVRLGAWNAADYAAGLTVVLLVFEYCRRKYAPIFYLNLLLVLYCVYGYMIPGIFNHPGLSWQRVGSALSLEMATGVFERLPQLGLSLIGAFLLLLATLRAFGCIDSILRISAALAGFSPRLLPQAAVAGSFAVAAVSGSGAANAATTGAVTIPMLTRAGLPRVLAAALETAASLGGQLMPPLMGISAFLMAELLGVGYFEVVARGFAPAIVYFLGVALGAHLLAMRHQTRGPGPPRERIVPADWLNLVAFALAMAALVWLMGYLRLPAMVAARQVFAGMALFLSALFLLRMGRGQGGCGWKDWLRPYAALVRHFAATTAEITLLLSALGALTAAFTVTGVPDKVGTLLMQLAEFNVALMILTAFAFGYLIGMGLPVAPTYIVLAVVATPFLVRAGFDPWVAHFFAFFVAVFGELSPPTSVTAAVTSRIAEASFVRTMGHAMGLCLPLPAMLAAVFVRPELVTRPGGAQMAAMVLVSVGCFGLIASLYGDWSANNRRNWRMRLALVPASLAVLFAPGYGWPALLALPVLALVLAAAFGAREFKGDEAGGV